MPAISVVIPAYNASRLIAHTLRSVLAQDLPDVEIIVVDDGSTDDTAVVVSQFSTVRLVTKTNGGLGSARNAGIRAAQGEFIGFVDSDDLWEPSKLRLQLELLRRTNLRWAYCDGYVFDANTGELLNQFSRAIKLREGDVLEPLLLDCFIASPTPLVHRAVFDDVGFFDETPLIHMREDWDMWLRIARGYPIALVPQPLVRYRVHSDANTSREDPLVALASQMAVVDRAIQRNPKRLEPLRRRAEANLFLGTGRSLASRGRLPEAGAVFRKAVRSRPTMLAGHVYGVACRLASPILPWAIRLRRRLRRGLL